MNKDTQKFITGIGQTVPKDLQNGMVKKEVEDKSSEAKSAANMLRRRGGMHNRQVADRLERMADRGDFRNEKDIVDPKKTAEIKKFVDTRIDAAIKNGKIPPPDMREYHQASKKMRCE